jgi:hypothetical protein
LLERDHRVLGIMDELGCRLARNGWNRVNWLDFWDSRVAKWVGNGGIRNEGTHGWLESHECIHRVWSFFFLLATNISQIHHMNVCCILVVEHDQLPNVNSRT